MTYLILPSASISQSGNWGHFYPLCEKAFWQSASRHWERSRKPMWTQKEPGSQMFLLLHPHWSLLSRTHLDVYGLPDWLRIPETRLLLLLRRERKRCQSPCLNNASQIQRQRTFIWYPRWLGGSITPPLSRWRSWCLEKLNNLPASNIPKTCT